MRPSDDPSPLAVPQFLELLRISKLVSDERVDALTREPHEPTLSAHQLAEQLVNSGELTRFQADKLLAGQPSGLVFGNYRILAPLGKGGMGLVYLARELPNASGRAMPLLALKILPPKRVAAKPQMRDRFEREMTLGKLVPPHPHLARVFDTGSANGVLYIAMEYVPGRTIKEIVQVDGPMPIGDAARVFAHVADGLAACHGVGLIHRDIKPANIMITPAGEGKLLDFGFALQIGVDLPRDPALIGGKGYILGTMDYIAPEQAADASDVSPLSDLYALGGSLYYALAGCPPFPGGSAMQKIRWHQQESPPPIRTLVPELPLELAAVVSRLMAKNPEDRFGTAALAAEILRQWATAPGQALPRITPDADASDELIHEEEPEPSEGFSEFSVPASEPAWWQVQPWWMWLLVLAALSIVSFALGYGVGLTMK